VTSTVNPPVGVSHATPKSEGTLAKFLRSVVRMTHLMTLFVYGAIQLLVTRPATLQQRAAWLQRFSTLLLRAMDVKTSCQGNFPATGVIVSNHSSYLEIMAMAAQHPCVFVARAELANIPLLGYMSTMAGTVYVQRGHGGSALKAKDSIQSAADAGVPIVIFPEGTTGDGSSLLEFRSGALGQAMETGLPVTAAFVSYELKGNNPPGSTVRNDVAFWGDAELFHHMFHLLALRGIQVNIHIADRPIEFTPGPINRKLAATEARAAVMQLGGLTDPPSCE
jgi:1-acyl-sn-glycerol-3-phosphate acyltransferase